MGVVAKDSVFVSRIKWPADADIENLPISAGFSPDGVIPANDPSAMAGLIRENIKAKYGVEPEGWHQYGVIWSDETMRKEGVEPVDRSAGSVVLRSGDQISAAVARSLVSKYGVLYVLVDGCKAQGFDVADIEDGDAFTVVIAYGYNVRLHLSDEDGRVDIVLAELFGRCDELIEDGYRTAPQWHTVADI